jgi:hypothetical protein
MTDLHPKLPITSFLLRLFGKSRTAYFLGRPQMKHLKNALVGLGFVLGCLYEVIVLRWLCYGISILRGQKETVGFSLTSALLLLPSPC